MMAPFIKFESRRTARVLALGIASVILCGVTFCGVASAQVEINNRNEVNANTELNVLLQAPKMPPLKWFASTDKTGKNDDFVLLKPGETRRVPLVTGDLVRLWSTGAEPDRLDMRLENGPGRVLPLLQNGKALLGTMAGRAYTLYPTITFDAARTLRPGATLVVTNRAKVPNKWYYQASIRPPGNKSLPLVPPATQVDKRQFKLNLGPGAEQEIETWDKPGLIYEFSVAVTEGSAKGVFEKLRLHAEWDGKEGAPGSHAIDAPLMSLTGQIEGTELIRNAVCDFDGTRLLLRWPMPFASARLSLHNESDKPLKLDVMARLQTFDTPPSEYRFCALERTAKTKKGQPIDILQTKGEGDFAGLALAIKPGLKSSRRTFAFLEGDETITADGQKFEGTGTEDYFSSAWYWDFTGGPFVRPYEGLTLRGESPPAVSAYRLHINDAIPFSKSLDFKFEHGNGNNSSDGDFEWKWVAFWYQKMPLPTGLFTAPSATPLSGPGPSLVERLIGGLLGVAIVGGVIAMSRLRRPKTRA
jgi:hypothetical protein